MDEDRHQAIPLVAVSAAVIEIQVAVVVVAVRIRADSGSTAVAAVVTAEIDKGRDTEEVKKDFVFLFS